MYCINLNSRFRYIMFIIYYIMGFPDGAMGKNPPDNAGGARDMGSVPVSWRSPGVGNGNPPQHSCLGNSMDRETWQASMHGVTKNQTRLGEWAHSVLVFGISVVKNQPANAGNMVWSVGQADPLKKGMAIPVFFFLLKKIVYFNWRLIILQYCDGFCHTSTWISHRCTCVPASWNYLPPHPIPVGCPRALALSTLLHASSLHEASISHMVIYMFQCYFLKSFHPRLIPWSPKVCSLHLCLLLPCI